MFDAESTSAQPEGVKPSAIRETHFDEASTISSVHKRSVREAATPRPTMRAAISLAKIAISLLVEARDVMEHPVSSPSFVAKLAIHEPPADQLAHRIDRGRVCSRELTV